ncbi:MAG: threonine--tRNA ligase [Proteobacteria bacterium]|nr:threonine--tRNA ligase [Pseudomonadota bacterium]MBU4296901.1 threonine--tRNA ligase [Pseudomonadota bacterium]MCG2749279.1 threonine--tRNA ligase [Desulfobulbaceae bacterium]
MADIQLSIAGGEVKNLPAGITVAEAVKALGSSKERKSIVAVRVGERLLDLSEPLKEDAVLAPVTKDSREGLYILRHSASHIMAQAVVELYGPNIQVAIGPATEDGFYYDFDRKEPFTPDDFAAIEAKVQEIVAANLPFTRETLSIDEAKKFFQEKGQAYKVELLDDIQTQADTVSIYQQGDFVDLCRGPHIAYTGLLQAFKLMRIAGAYWRGDEKRPMLQRLYGTAFYDAKELKKYLFQLEEAKKRDHRKLGKELELFAISDQVGPGLILWLPKGAQVRRVIEDYWKDEHYRNGYELLYTPHIAKREMWATSGHLDFYVDDMFSPMEVEDVSYQIKPMNCPFHIGIYKTRKRSYREFPIRWCELGTVYRFERTGALQGLMRVRGFTQDDAHIFCLPEQLEEEIFNIIDLNLHILKTFGFSEYDIYLSTRPEKYVGSDENWQKATDALKMALEKKGLSYTVDPGEGVFYGPKIDIKIKDVLGRAWQCSTIQVDFNLPERFQLAYTAEDSRDHQPIMIHRALMGSLERFFGVLIEHYAGAFPLWMAPVQAKVLNITDAQFDYTEKVYQELRQANVRVEKDIRNEKLNYKIREAQLAKIPYMVIIGDKEKDTNTVTVRLRDGKNLEPMSVSDFAEMIREESRIR